MLLFRYLYSGAKQEAEEEQQPISPDDTSLGKEVMRRSKAHYRRKQEQLEVERLRKAAEIDFMPAVLDSDVPIDKESSAVAKLANKFAAIELDKEKDSESEDEKDKLEDKASKEAPGVQSQRERKAEKKDSDDAEARERGKVCSSMLCPVDLDDVAGSGARY